MMGGIVKGIKPVFHGGGIQTLAETSSGCWMDVMNLRGHDKKA